MKILVAGGAGYIGSALLPALIDRGYEVEVIDLMWFGNHLPENVKVTQKDLFNCTKEDFEDFEQIIFLAGISNDPMAEFNPKKNFTDNGALPSYLAFLAKSAGVKRFIYASSCSVYGYTLDKLYNEEDPVTSNYPYGISKLQGERGCLQMQDENFSVIALRQGTVCGYSPRMRMDLIVNTMFKTALTEGRIVVNNPSIWRPIYDIRDAVTGYLRAIQAHYSISGVFNVASGNYTVGQVADIVKAEIDKLTGSDIKIEILNQQDFRNYKVTTEQASTKLGFKSQYDVKDIVHHLYNNYEKFKDFENDNYYNIKVFKKLLG
ncbi:MAG: nucleoside-diphosphate-sugar epimerase [Methanobacterium sp. Maddingley MBC34]|nr:MAG: nucleoside-diphosphate-sugar epimerase [Methanobacterium sp. Maddingley MBC34]